MNAENKYIRFDWAVKRMLRDKANFGVLEGLITVLLGEPAHIVELLESESNQESEDDKFNRVDIKAKNDRDEIFIVEVQLTRQLYYLERILYGVAKTLTEHIKLGSLYNEVKKVYSISIVYFDLGKGSDYLYHGQTSFVGVHSKDTLEITYKESKVIRMKTPEEVFPEYYIIRVNEFNDVARTPLEEWIDYLKNGNIKDDTTTPGLSEAKEKLQYLMMSKADRIAYERHLDAIMVQEDVLTTAKTEGFAEGREEGLAEGREEGLAEGREEGFAKGKEEGFAKGKEEGREKGREEGERANAMAVAKRLKERGIDWHIIADSTGLAEADIKAL